jgi:hypothetical protein
MSLQVPTMEEFQSLNKVVEDLKSRVKALESLPPPPEWVTIEQAAQMMKRHKQTVREMAHRGDLTLKKGQRKMEILTESIRQYNLKHTIAA